LTKINKEDITYRAGKDDDIPQIVALLRASLGEELLPKSESFWNWKHVINPFGKSPLAIAVHNDKIIGVRAFMQWSWAGNNKNYRALRAVDTAVHPDYQGFGIFTKLTLGLVNTCKEEGFDLIFNTPNDKSRPGYLKMGWVAIGKLPIRIRFLAGARRSSMQSLLMTVDSAVNLFFEKDLGQHAASFLCTPVSQKYLLWRYHQVPGQQYYGWTDANRSLLVIIRVKKKKWVNEVRIVSLVSRGEGNEASALREFISTIRKGGPSYLSCTPHEDDAVNAALSRNFFFPALRLGPVVTIRKIRDTFDVESFAAQWRPAMGDMELF
jgi:N-acetylglutamate synthase-like GNAT family acetyltransferase